ncbi:MAG: hypothetical protein EXS16_06055 [Gemmataceae bacterium]|nr:hypothetical protein [Gemmataceae bacterium]
MDWRKWVVRGIVYGIVGAAVTGALIYQRLTNPGAVREQVIAEIAKAFPGANISVDSARLRILGGIQLNGVRLTRADDPEKSEFLHIPSAIFYHDKEKILEGQLTLRKIELVRPRMRVRRERDGTFNLQGLTRPPTDAPKTIMPTIVIHNGTLILEDRADQGKATSLEINDIGMTIVNDPLPRVTIRGAAESGLLGKLNWQGTLDRMTNEAILAFKAKSIVLSQALLARLPLPIPPEVQVGLQLSATAHVEGRVSYHPKQAQPLFYDVNCEIEHGKVQHPKLPLPLEKIGVKLHCSNGALQVHQLSAVSGSMEISAHGAGQLPALDQEFEMHVDMKHVPLGEELAIRLPEKIRELHRRFQPEGPTTIRIACARHDGQWVTLSSGKPSTVSLEPEKVAIVFKNFAYPLRDATGKVDYNLLNKHIDVRLTAFAGKRPVFLSGHWTGDVGNQADVEFNFHGHGLDIDDTLIRALPLGLQKFAESFHATGKLDVRAHIRHEVGKEYRNEYHIHFHDAAICWAEFPYALTKVSGNLDIYPEHWEFHEFQGIHKEGHVMLHGKSIPKIEKNGEKTFGISMEITGRDIPLDNALQAALSKMPGMQKAWETFGPTGRLYFTANVNRPTPDIKDLEVHVDAHGCNIKPAFFPFDIQDLRGKFHFHDNRLDLAMLRAKHHHAIIKLDKGYVDLNQRGGYYADLANFEVQGLKLDNDFVNATPRMIQDVLKNLNWQGPIRAKSRIVVSQPAEIGKPPDVYWDGVVQMFDAKFTTGLEFANVTGELACTGRYNGRQIVGLTGNVKLDNALVFDQPLKNMHAQFQMRETSPDVLLVSLRAPIFSGDLTGQLRVDFGSSMRYELNLTASQINVAEFGRLNFGPRSQISGIAGGRLFLTGLGTGMDSLEGNGSLDIARAHLYNLPVLLDLLKYLGNKNDDRTAFEEFHADFAIQGPRVSTQRFDLFGSTISLAGKGDYHLDTKKVEMDVYPMWGRVEQLLPPVIRPLPTTVSKNLFTVEIRGKMTSNPKDLRFQMKPVPLIVDPLLLVRDRIFGQPNATPTSLPVQTPPRVPERIRWFRMFE